MAIRWAYWKIYSKPVIAFLTGLVSGVGIAILIARDWTWTDSITVGDVGEWVVMFILGTYVLYSINSLNREETVAQEKRESNRKNYGVHFTYKCGSTIRDEFGKKQSSIQQHGNSYANATSSTNNADVVDFAENSTLAVFVRELIGKWEELLSDITVEEANLFTSKGSKNDLKLKERSQVDKQLSLAINNCTESLWRFLAVLSIRYQSNLSEYIF